MPNVAFATMSSVTSMMFTSPPPAAWPHTHLRFPRSLPHAPDPDDACGCASAAAYRWCGVTGTNDHHRSHGGCDFRRNSRWLPMRSPRGCARSDSPDRSMCMTASSRCRSHACALHVWYVPAACPLPEAACVWQGGNHDHVRGSLRTQSGATASGAPPPRCKPMHAATLTYVCRETPECCSRTTVFRSTHVRESVSGNKLAQLGLLVEARAGHGVARRGKGGRGVTGTLFNESVRRGPRNNSADGISEKVDGVLTEVLLAHGAGVDERLSVRRRGGLQHVPLSRNVSMPRAACEPRAVHDAAHHCGALESHTRLSLLPGRPVAMVL